MLVAWDIGVLVTSTKRVGLSRTGTAGVLVGVGVAVRTPDWQRTASSPTKPTRTSRGKNRRRFVIYILICSQCVFHLMISDQSSSSSLFLVLAFRMDSRYELTISSVLAFNSSSLERTLFR